MGNGYTVAPKDGYDAIIRELQSLRGRMKELERPTGTQLSSTVATLQQLVDGLIEQTEVNVTGNITTTGGNVTAAGNGTFNNKLYVPNAYSNNLTGSGGYRTAYWSLIGEAGYVPSSRRFKRDIKDAALDPADILGIRLVSYRYKDAVAEAGDDAPVDVGVIAEEVDALGLSFLIDYEIDEEGNARPFGFKYERLAVALLAVVKDLAGRVAELER